MSLYAAGHHVDVDADNGAIVYSGHGTVVIDDGTNEVTIQVHKVSLPFTVKGGSSDGDTEIRVISGFIDADGDAGSTPADRTPGVADQMYFSGDDVTSAANDSNAKVLEFAHGAAYVTVEDEVNSETVYRIQDYFVDLSKLKMPCSIDPIGSLATRKLTMKLVGENTAVAHSE